MAESIFNGIPLEETNLYNAGQIWHAGVVNASLGAGSNVDVLVQTSSIPHMAIINFSTSDDLEGWVYEDCTVSANGTALALTQFNRSVSSSTPVLMYEAPTITTLGTELEHGLILAGTSKTPSISGTSQRGTMAANTKYLIRIQNNSTGASKVTLGIILAPTQF